MIRTISLFFIVMAMASCTTEHISQEKSKEQYMSREDVLKEYNSFSEREEREEPLTPEQEMRKANLIPDSKFLEGMPSKPKALFEKAIPSDAPKQVDLRFRDTKVSSQDNGKCTAWSITAGLENTLNREGNIKGLNMSEWHSWSFYKQYSASAAIKALSNPKNRVGDEKDYPQYGKAKAGMVGHTYISKYKYIGDDESEVVDALRNGNVIYLAMKVPKSMMSCPKVISPFSAAESGGHAILGVGYMLDDAGKVLLTIKNSWGTNCGDKGYQILPLSICHKSGFYCDMWVIEEVNTLLQPIDIDPTPTPTPVKPVKFKTVCSRSFSSLWLKKTCRQVPVE